HIRTPGWHCGAERQYPVDDLDECGRHLLARQHRGTVQVKAKTSVRWARSVEALGAPIEGRPRHGLGTPGCSGCAGTRRKYGQGLESACHTSAPAPLLRLCPSVHPNPASTPGSVNC